MKRVGLFSFFIFLIISIVSFLIFKPKNYQTVYEKDNFKIEESYNKKDKLYTFKLTKDKQEYYYINKGKYSINRKIVSSIRESDNCITLFVNKYNLGTECLKNNNLVSKSIINEKNNDEKINTIQRYSIYNDTLKYYAWNSYGLLDILGKSEHKYLDKETYDNNFTYQMGNYIILADYDLKREFNTFYIFNTNTNKYFELKSDNNISYDSYFMGDIKSLVYLFDKKNKVQYEININKKKISIISDNDKVRFYNKGWTYDRIDKYVYDDIKFIKDDIYKYEIIDKKLYLSLKGYNKKILVSNKFIKDIIKITNNTVYYLVDSTIYRFNLVDGESKLIDYFDWNFSYLNKIYIID